MSDYEEITLEQAFEECKELWEILSEIPTFTIKKKGWEKVWGSSLDMKEFHPRPLKQDILSEVMGLGFRSNGCPFCHASRIFPHGMMECEINCPIAAYEQGPDIEGHCSDSPYVKWEEEFRKTGVHNQDKAKDFYEYIVRLHEQWRREECSKTEGK